MKAALVVWGGLELHEPEGACISSLATPILT